MRWAYPQRPPQSSGRNTRFCQELIHRGVHQLCPEKERPLCSPTQITPRNWFALRVTYGRERSAYDYLVSMGVKAFCPMHRVAKIIKGKRRLVMQSRLPNLFFAYGTEEELQQFVYDNTNLPFLRFYYRYYHDERHSMKKEPLIVSDEQIETFRIICESTDHGTFVSSDEIHLFERGELVRVTAPTTHQRCCNEKARRCIRCHGFAQARTIDGGDAAKAQSHLSRSRWQFRCVHRSCEACPTVVDQSQRGMALPPPSPAQSH